MPKRDKRWILQAILLVTFMSSGCGGPDFEAIKGYKNFLEGAKQPLQKMNSVREELFQLSHPSEMQAKFQKELLPEVNKLKELANQHTTPEVAELKGIHTTLQQVLKNYSEATDKLVKELEQAQQTETNGLAAAKKIADEDERKASEAKATASGDRIREQALITWGEADQAFGSKMQELVESLTTYLDSQMKR